ncbi:MAG: hypothetical protein LBS17_06995 [Actinomycetes bacterium]|nr:hypothetical protein [Actinomycetes bacterium]
MSVLFTPVGKSDRKGLDPESEGAICHIIRNYTDIDTVVLYISDELLAEDAKDPFPEYIHTVRPGLHVEYAKRPDLVDVHRFDAFYDDFGSELTKISHESPDSPIYVNLTSGTAAMQSSLMVLCEVFHRKLIPLQVDNPQYNSSGNRCYEVQTKNFRRLIILENIKALIAQYDYHGARELATGVVSPESMQLIEGAVDRYELRSRQARKKLGHELSNELMGQTSPIGKCFEYLQYLSVLEKRAEWAGFVRGADPATVGTLLCLVDAFTEFDRTELVKSGTVAVLNVEYVQGDPELKKYFKSAMEARSADKYIGWFPLTDIVRDRSRLFERDVIDAIERIGGLQRTRNRFVHNIEAVDVNAEKLAADWQAVWHTLLKAAAAKAEEVLPPWDSYNKLNETIIRSL